MGDRRTQGETVVRYLRNHRKGLTSMKAFWLFRITRLSARIHELRHKGYDILTIKEDNKFCPGQHARYVLLKEPDNEMCASL